jgi:hypothetical protein
MDVLGLTIEELRAAAAACAHIRIPEPAPDYLRRFLVARLEGDRPDLAATVAALDDWQFSELCGILRSLQSRQARPREGDVPRTIDGRSRWLGRPPRT